MEKSYVKNIIEAISAVEYFKEIYPLFNNISDDDITFKTSSGSTTVFLFKGYDFVLQVYKDKGVFTRIIDIFYTISMCPFVNIDITHQTGFGRRSKIDSIQFRYDLRKYVIYPREYFSDHNAIIFDRIIPITNRHIEIPEYMKQDDYILKLIWDTSLALEGIHKSGYIHGDCTLDNIGITKTKNFILFDLDMSRPISDDYPPENDFRILKKSLEFHLGRDSSKAKLVSISQEHLKRFIVDIKQSRSECKTLSDVTKFLDNITLP